MSRSRSGIANVGVYFCRVMAVHQDDYSVDAISEYLGQFFFRIGYATMYVHHANGEGTYCIPEVGSWCWVCIPSDHNKPFVLSFMAPFSLVDEHKAGRLDLVPGDQAMISRDLNGIIVRRGGVVQVSATPVCQRIYSPIANTIRDFCENYELQAAGGSLTWTVRRNTPNEQALSPSLLTLEAREFAQQNPVVILKIGSGEVPVASPPLGPSIQAGRKIYLDLEVKGATGLTAFRYRVNLDGETLMLQEGKRSIHVKDDEIHFVDGNREFQAMSEDVRVTGASSRLYGSEDVKVTGQSKETVGSKMIFAPSIVLGGVGAVPTVRGPDLLQWALTHVHPTAAGPSGPAIPPLSPSVLTTVVKVT